jgi:hypothetical protein
MTLLRSNKHTPVALPLATVIALFVVIALWRHQIGAHLPLSVDEAYYVAWSKSLDWGYWTKPPFIAWGIGAARWVCGETAACVRSTSLILFPVTSLALLALAYRMTSSLTMACLTAVLFATLPLSAFYGIAATTDTFLLLFWCAAMLSLWLALEGKSWAWPMLGLCFGLGMLSKYTMVVFGLSALLVMLHPRWIHAWRTRGPYLALLVAAVVFMPNVVWNMTHQMPTFQHTADISQGGNAYGLHWDVLGKFLLEQVLIGNPVLVVGWGLTIAQCIKKPTPHNWFAISTSLPIVLIISAQALLSRSNANWAAPAYLGVTLAATTYLWPRFKKSIVAALAFNALFSITLYHYQTVIAEPFGLRGTAAADPFWAVRPWPSLVHQIENELATEPDRSHWRIASEDRAVLAQTQALLNLPAGSALGWQRDRHPDNHFDQHFPLQAESPLSVLLVTRRSDAEVKQAFPGALKKSQIQAESASEQVTYQLWWLDADK